MPDMTRWPASNVKRMLEMQRRYTQMEEQQRKSWNDRFETFHARANLRDGKFKSPVDRFYVSADMAIVSPPASTRAALVLGAVGCDWRAIC
jgi:hypothetical protein